MKRWFVVAILILPTMGIGCREKEPIKPLIGTTEPYRASEGSVGLDLSRISGAGSNGEWLASYISQGKATRFRVQIDPWQSTSSGIGFGKGRFFPVEGSDPTPLISALKTALEAKTIPPKSKKVSQLEFLTAYLGENMSQMPDGGFDSKTPGGWVAMKLFFEDTSDEAQEVYFNYNPASNKAEFSIKDSEYGDALLSKFAKVF